MLFFPRYRFWVHVTVVGIGIFILASFYQFLAFGSYTKYLANRAFADTAVILIALSFALSGIAFFWKNATKFLPYRKELGIVGFVFALIHTGMTLFVLPDVFPFPDYFLSLPLPFIFSSITVLIYAMMVIVSNFGVPAKIGGIMWRRLLRVGYIGILFTIFHFGIMQFDSWRFWLQQPFDSLPPSSFIMLIVSIATLLLRIVLAVMLPKKSTPTSSIDSINRS